jgi:beta-xylosidase
MSPDASRLLGEGAVVFEKPERHHTIEGPKFLKRDGWYYILAPAGGVATGWQTVLRSRNIFGPYEDRIVLEQGNTPVNGPHQGGLVSTPDDEWWFLHFQDAGVYGRLVHLQPVEWQDGWPLMGCDSGGLRVPVLQHRKPLAGVNSVSAIPQTNDEFTSSRLGLQWQWYANHKDDWHSLVARSGWLRLFAQPHKDLARTPSLLLQKFPARAFVAETQLELSSSPNNAEAGIVVTGNEHAALALRAKERDTQVVFLRGSHEQVLGSLPSRKACLRVKVVDGGACHFRCASEDGKELAPSEEFQAAAGKWIGAKIGIYCHSQVSSIGFADFDYFRFITPT